MTELQPYAQEKMLGHVRAHPYPLIFATLSGAHLYGFPSPDSDFDLRGVHLLPLELVVGLVTGQETVEKEGVSDSIEIDLVTHDAAKFFRLMLGRNGYVLEQIFSPLVVYATPAHEELKAIAANCITRHHAHHYLGFAARQWKLFSQAPSPRVKPLLYVYRVLLTGIHLMRTGRVEANLIELNKEAQLTYLDDLLAQKLSGPEKAVLEDVDLAFHTAETQRLTLELERAHQESKLPNMASAGDALNDLLVRLRLSLA